MACPTIETILHFRLRPRREHAAVEVVFLVLFENRQAVKRTELRVVDFATALPTAKAIFFGVQTPKRDKQRPNYYVSVSSFTTLKG